MTKHLIRGAKTKEREWHINTQIIRWISGGSQRKNFYSIEKLLSSRFLLADEKQSFKNNAKVKGKTCAQTRIEIRNA